MKLVIATPLYPPEIGGPATYAKILEEGLPGRGIEVEVVKFSGVRHLPRLIRHYVYYRQVLKAVRNADAVLALDPVSVGLPAMKAAQKAGKPFIVKIVGDYAWEQGQQRFGITQNLDEFVKEKRVPFPVRLLRRIQTRVARSASYVIVPSEYLRGIVATWGIYGAKVHMIYNAVQIEGKGEVPEAVAQLQGSHIVTVGRLVPWKNIDQIIDAVAQIPSASLIIVGDGPEKGSLENKVKEKLSGRATFTGNLSHKDTIAVMESAKVIVLYSSYEGLSHMLIESMMLGSAATVAAAVGGNPEVIPGETVGVLIPPNDVPALTRALANLLNDSKLRMDLASQAKESAKRFSPETMLDATARLLTSL